MTVRLPVGAPTLRTLNPDYSLKRSRFADDRWWAVLGWHTNGCMAYRGAPVHGTYGQIASNDPKARAVAPVAKKIGNTIAMLKRLAPPASRAHLGAPFEANDVGPRDPGRWQVTIAAAGAHFTANADFVELATRVTYRRAVSPDATWRWVTLDADQTAVTFRDGHPAECGLLALVDPDGRLGAFVAPKHV